MSDVQPADGGNVFQVSPEQILDLPAERRILND
jgi:hypothetical protein